MAWLLLLGFVSGCSSEGPERDSGIRGELVVYIADFDDGTSETQYFLRVGGNERDERRLIFATDPELSGGTELEVHGVARGDAIEVVEFDVIGGSSGQIGSQSEELVGAPPLATKRFAWVFVDIGGGVNPPLSEDEARRRLFGTNSGDNSIKQYYLETSYGRQDITGDIFGPLPYTMTGCNTSSLASALTPQIPGTYNHYLWYLGSRNSACSWSGLAQVGSPTSPAKNSWYNARSGCVVLVQEPGHNFGMQHSSEFDCGSAVFLDDPNQCTHDEYGDSYDPMGGGCRHMNGWQKTYQGWHGGTAGGTTVASCNSVRVTSSGTFTLFPLETPCNGIQVLQIRMPKDRPYTRPAGGGGSGGTDTLRYYYLELRTSVGFDAGMTGVPTVLVHVADDYRAWNQSGRHTWILDMNPATSTIDGIRTASTGYTDPAGGLSFTVEAISTTQATIRVDITSGTGAPTCLDGSTLTPPGPGSCSGGGTGGNGSPCTTGGGCSSGFCVDGVCCNAPCTSACQACTAAKKGSGSNGVCGPIADGTDPDAECTDQGAASCGTDGSCSGGGACRQYPSGTVCGTATCSNGTVTGSTCIGGGACVAGSTSCGLYACASGTACGTSCSSDANCVATAYCRGSDNTCQPDQGTGGSCSSSSQCQSGSCVDGFCCDAPCTGLCRACSAARKGTGSNGVCGNVGGGTDPDAECADDGNTSCDRDGSCDGSGACRLYATGTSCGTNTCTNGVQSGQSCDGFGSCNPANVTQCAPYQCLNASSCATTCTSDALCVASTFCETATGTCRPDRPNGTGCSNDSQCISGFCTDGTCCDQRCNGLCRACTAALTAGGSDGQCGFVAGGSDPGAECPDDGSASCDRNGSCNGSGACQLHSNGTACGASTCSSGTQTGFACDGFGTCSPASTSACTPYVCSGSACGTSCTNDAGCVANHHCSGGTCRPDQDNGAPCTATSQCTSGQCADGFCCDTICNGLCQACSAAKKGAGANGACGAISGGSDPDTECVDEGAGSCGQDGECSGSGSCRTYAQGTACGATTCSGGVQTGFACNGTGTCIAAQTATCNPYVCNGSACGGSCGSDAGCVPGAYCNATGECDPDQPTGAPCSLASQCQSGFCIDGVCCSADCSGPCQACSTVAKGGGANGACGPVALGTDPDNDCPVDQPTSCLRTGDCNGAGACERYGPGTVCGAATCSGSTLSGQQCDGSGTCASGQTTSCAPYNCAGSSACGTGCSTTADCIGANVCIGGVCTARKPNGDPCSSLNECESGFCIDGVCCDTACDALCQACAAIDQLGGRNGVCGPARDGTDPHDDCTDEGAQNCGLDGSCNGAGQCARFPNGAPCGATSCVNNSVTGQICDGAGTCLSDSTVPCGNFACVSGACTSDCVTFADCAETAYCNAGTCETKKPNGGDCNAAADCVSDFCVDGVCCNTECLGQCEACDDPSAPGTCTPITGAPHQERLPCQAGTTNEPCSGRGCDGITRDSCAGLADTTCRPGTCDPATGVATPAATCDGQGACPPATTQPCGRFVCQGTACGSGPCDANDDCAAGYRCDTSLSDCVPSDSPICDVDGRTLRKPDGTTTDCSPYACEGGACKAACSTSGDCVSGIACENGVCASASGARPPIALSGDTSCACSVPERDGGRGAWGATALIVLGLLRRRRRVTSSRSAV